MDKGNSVKSFFKSSKGTSILIFTLALTAILGFTALVTDIGVIFTERARLSSAVDAAALAGAQELVKNSGNVNNIVQNYISKNIGTLKAVDITTNTSSRTIEVKGTKTVNNLFAKVIGISSQDIWSSAKAKIENIKSLKGSRPLAIIQQTFTYGVRYTLKEGAGDGLSGNYAAISLGGAGGSIYRDNLLNGYGGIITVGDTIPTETGNIAGTTETSVNYLINSCTHTPQCTYQSYNSSCSRIIFLPVVNTLDVNGRKYIKVLGFATFFLEGVINHGGQADVVGRFITYNMQGETSSEVNDYGTYGIKLIK